MAKEKFTTDLKTVAMQLKTQLKYSDSVKKAVEGSQIPKQWQIRVRPPKGSFQGLSTSRILYFSSFCSKQNLCEK